jgi:hypothetical protein
MCGVDTVHGETAILTQNRRFARFGPEVPVVAVTAALLPSPVAFGPFAGELKADVR